MADGTIQPSKVCTKCSVEKLATEFPIYKGTYRRGACKACTKAAALQCPSRTQEARKARSAAYYRENQEKIRTYLSGWRRANRDKIVAANREWRKRNRDRDRRNAHASNQRKRRDPGHRLRESIASQINQGLRGSKRGRRWESLVGYTIDDLRRHLERQFTRGMSWDNYGKWHVDHIVPASSFQYQTPEDDDFRHCWALTNLRPMWAKANIAKGDKRLFLI